MDTIQQKENKDNTKLVEQLDGSKVANVREKYLRTFQIFVAEHENLIVALYMAETNHIQTEVLSRVNSSSEYNNDKLEINL